MGSALLIFGIVFGSIKWIEGGIMGLTSSAGTVMLAALPVLIGLQMILAALNYDVQSVPRTPLQRLLAASREAAPSHERQPISRAP